MNEDTTPRPDATPSPLTQGCTLSRRAFIEGIGATAGLLAAGTIPGLLSVLPKTAEASEGSTALTGDEVLDPILEHDKPLYYPGKPVYYADPPGKQKWAMVIDTKACIGCRRCVYACVEENNIGRDSGFTYIQVLEMERGKIELESSTLDYEEGGKPDKVYMPVQCMHCAEPPCVYGCPVKATWREPDGIVVIDYNKCISCRNCMITCPYDARHFNWIKPEVPEAEVNPDVPLEEKAYVVEKCTFCVHRTRNGKTTACVEACPVGARTFGDLSDPESDVSTLLKTRQVIRLKEELGTEPMIWYVG